MLEIWVVCGAALAVFVGVSALGIRRNLRIYRAVQARMAVIQEAEQPVSIVKHWDSRWQDAPLIGRESRWQKCVVVVTQTQIIVYERSEAVTELARFEIERLRWFGRPEKYTPSTNEIWLHFEEDSGWRLVRFRLYQEYMRELVRTLKQVTTPELVTAYRRRRPYIHFGPAAAQPAAQDIHGAWTLGEPVQLYLMPRFLVILEDGKVERTLALETVQQIGALRRLDQPGAQGLVRFRAGDESLAFALGQHEAFAGALAEAAKRTLEAPVERKQKGKKDYEDEEEEWE